MKHNDDYSKKLIKNFVYLVVSALVLVSATVAWFAKNSKADVNAITAAMNGEQFDISFYRADGLEEEFVYDTSEDEIVSISLEEKEALTWKPTENIDIKALYPGVYDAFKVVIIVNEDSGSSSFDFNEISCAVAEDMDGDSKETFLNNVYKSVFYRAIAVKGDSLIGKVGSFESMNESKTLSLMDLGEIKKGDTITVYFDIGIPGDDVNGTHAVLQETGATIRIGSVEISG